MVLRRGEATAAREAATSTKKFPPKQCEARAEAGSFWPNVAGRLAKISEVAEAVEESSREAVSAGRSRLAEARPRHGSDEAKAERRSSLVKTERMTRP